MNEKKLRHKTTRNYFLLILAGGILGGILGVSSTFLGESVSGLIAALNVFLQRTSPWVLLFFSLASLLISYLTLRRSQCLSTDLDGEDDSRYEHIEKILDFSIGTSSVGLILTMSWYGLVVVAVTSDQCKLTGFFAATAAFLLSTVFHSFLQRKCVDLTKKLNPEKQGDALSLHFHKEWLKSCDEQEQLTIYRACYKSFIVLPVLCCILFIILVLSAFQFEIGILPFLLVGIIWLVQTVIYLMECRKNRHVQ